MKINAIVLTICSVPGAIAVWNGGADKPLPEEQYIIDEIVRMIALIIPARPTQIYLDCKNTNSDNCCQLAYDKKARDLLQKVPKIFIHYYNFSLWSSDASPIAADPHAIPGNTRSQFRCNLRYTPGYMQLQVIVKFETVLSLLCEPPLEVIEEGINVFQKGTQQFKQAFCRPRRGTSSSSAVVVNKQVAGVQGQGWTICVELSGLNTMSIVEHFNRD